MLNKQETARIFNRTKKVCLHITFLFHTRLQIRESFNNTLPHPQTVRRWFSTVNFSPGINKSVLINIKNMIESERSKDKELQFGMQVDEMSLKKQIEFKHGECYGLVDIGGSNNTGKNEEASYAP